MTLVKQLLSCHVCLHAPSKPAAKATAPVPWCCLSMLVPLYAFSSHVRDHGNFARVFLLVSCPADACQQSRYRGIRGCSGELLMLQYANSSIADCCPAAASFAGHDPAKMIIGLNPPFGEDGRHFLRSFCHMALQSELLPAVRSQYDTHPLQLLRSSALLWLRASRSPVRSAF